MKYLNEISLRSKLIRLFTVFLGMLILSACGGGGGSSGTPSGTAATLFTSAPGTLSLAIGVTKDYTITGGRSPYTVSSSDSNVAVANVSGDTFSIAGRVVGASTITVRDAIGGSVSVSVTVAVASSGTALYTTAPSSPSISVGTANQYVIAGGAAPYTVSSSDTNAVLANILNGNTLNIAGAAVGTSQVLIFDAAGKSVTISVNVVIPTSGTALYTTAPSALTIPVAASLNYSISGGSPSYSAASSDPSIATATVTGSTLTINGLKSGSAQISVIDLRGISVKIQVSVGTGGVTPLFSTAPTAVTFAKGIGATYSVGGGTGPYAATTSDTTVATVSVSGTSLTITGGTAGGSAQVRVVDATGASLTIGVTVGSGTSSALFTSAPSVITLGIDPAGQVTAAGTQSYTIGGGTGPYTVTSSNVAMATVTIDKDNKNLMVITGISSSSSTNPDFTITTTPANVVIRDSLGATVSIAVIVAPKTSGSTPTVLPNAATANVGSTLNFSVSGGSPNISTIADPKLSYIVTVNNPSIASVTSISSGGSFTATMLNVGTTTVSIVDSVGQATTLTLTVNARSTALGISPNVWEIGENDKTASIDLNIYGGTAPYRAFTSDLVLSSVSIATNIMTVGMGSQANRCITPVSTSGVSYGGYEVTFTVVDATGAVATSALTIRDNGGTCP